MEGTSFVDSFQDFDRAGQKFPLPDPVPGVLISSLCEFRKSYEKWKAQVSDSYYRMGFSKLSDKDLKEVRASDKTNKELAEIHGVSPATIQRARGPKLKIPKL